MLKLRDEKKKLVLQMKEDVKKRGLNNIVAEDTERRILAGDIL